MDFVDDLMREFGDSWLSAIYKNKIRTLRTRAYSLDVADIVQRAEILHTLLGVELKIANKRIACPDLSTARYLQVFARLGCKEIAVPYDISKISVLADELESSWQRLLLAFDKITGDKTPQAKGRLRSALIKSIRNEIAGIGAGEKMPEFRQSTKQRAG